MSQAYPSAAAVPVRGATIPVHHDAGGPGASAPAADEAAVMNILRVLGRARGGTGLDPIDRAFVLAAKAMFAELVTVCDALLSRPPGAGGAARPAAAAGGEESVPAAGPPAGESPRKRRPITRGGGSGMA
jgi:hypothetical protein